MRSKSGEEELVAPTFTTERNLNRYRFAPAAELEDVVSAGNEGLPASYRHFNFVFAGILALVVLGALLRLTSLHAHLWIDEGITWAETSGLSPTHGFANSANTFAALFHYLMNNARSERLAPLYYCLLYFWRELFGDGEASLHLLSILMSVASLILLVDAARRLFGERGALWAAAVGGSSAFLVAYGEFVRPYAMLIFFTCIVIDAWAADCTSVRGGKGPIGWCALGAAGLTAGIAFSFIPLTMMALCDWRLRSNWRRWALLWGPSAALSILIFLGLYGGWIFWGGSLKVPDRQGLLMSLLFALYGVAVGETYGPTVQALHRAHQFDLVLAYWPRLLLLAGILSSLVVNIVRVLSRSGGASAEIPMLALRSLVFALLGSMLLGAAVGYFAHLNWLPRHAFFAAPILVLIVAALPTLNASALAAATTAAVFIVLNLMSIFNMEFRPEYGLDDYAGVARYLNSPDVRGSRPVMVYGIVPLLRDYYHVSGLVDGLDLGPDQLGASLKDLTGGASDVTLVIDRPWDWPRSALDAVQAHCYQLREHRQFNYFDLYRLTLDEKCS